MPRDVRLAVGEHAHGEDAPAARAIDAQPHAVAGVDLFAFVRQAAEQADRVAADRFELFVRQVQAERGVDVFDVRAGLDDRFVVGDLANRFFFALVVLVANLADDLFEQIFHRHEPGRSAVFVDDDRQRILAALHLAQQFGDALALRARARPGASARAATSSRSCRWRARSAVRGRARRRSTLSIVSSYTGSFE